MTIEYPLDASSKQHRRSRCDVTTFSGRACDVVRAFSVSESCTHSRSIREEKKKQRRAQRLASEPAKLASCAARHQGELIRVRK